MEYKNQKQNRMRLWDIVVLTLCLIYVAILFLNLINLNKQVLDTIYYVRDLYLVPFLIGVTIAYTLLRRFQ